MKFPCDCGHDHQSNWPENYPYPDKVCPNYPALCKCISYSHINGGRNKPIVPQMCRRCGTIDSGRGFHQAECMSSWVSVPAENDFKTP